MLTAVPETIFLLVKCKTGTSIEVKLAFAASMQNNSAISFVLIQNPRQIQIHKRVEKVTIEAYFK